MAHRRAARTAARPESEPYSASSGLRQNTAS
jgi:hypothetical protein